MTERTEVYIPNVKRFGDEIIYGTTPPISWRRDYMRAGMKTLYQFYDTHPDFVYLDTETTNLSGVFGGFVQIGILDKDGNELFGKLIDPQAPIEEKAFKAHGISQLDIDRSGAKPFDHHYEELADIIHGKAVVVYNAKFDSQFMQGQCLRYGKEPFYVDEWWDLMMPVAYVLSGYNSRFRDFTYMKLAKAGEKLKVKVPANLHDAIADCHLTRGIMETMRHNTELAKLVQPISPRKKKGETNAND